jgi:hypothetical protein
VFYSVYLEYAGSLTAFAWTVFNENKKLYTSVKYRLPSDCTESSTVNPPGCYPAIPRQANKTDWKNKVNEKV